MDWFLLAQDRDQWRALVITVPYNAEKFWSSCTTGGFSRKTQLREVSYLRCKVTQGVFKNHFLHHREENAVGMTL
jgi:hypothetical protein